MSVQKVSEEARDQIEAHIPGTEVIIILVDKSTKEVGIATNIHSSNKEYFAKILNHVAEKARLPKLII